MRRKPNVVSLFGIARDRPGPLTESPNPVGAKRNQLVCHKKATATMAARRVWSRGCVEDVRGGFMPIDNLLANVEHQFAVIVPSTAPPFFIDQLNPLSMR